MAKKRNKPVKLPDVKDHRDEIKVKDPVDITKDIKGQKFENEKKEWETEKAKYDATIAGLTKISLKVESETAFEEMIKERKLEPMQAEFLKLNFSSFAPESKENLRKLVGTDGYDVLGTANNIQFEKITDGEKYRVYVDFYGVSCLGFIRR